METSFFSGSENLYKYLVTIGMLLMVMTVYYPLKEKQELEILTIKLKNDLSLLKYKIENNAKDVRTLSKNIKKNGYSDINNKLIEELDRLNKNDAINQIEIDKKYDEIKARSFYISIYGWMFCIFFPIGVILTIYGFLKWKNAKKFDDNILELENEKLELQVKELRKQAERTQASQSQSE